MILSKLRRYKRQYGLAKSLYYAKNKLIYGHADDYPRWLKRHALGEEELAAQRAAHFEYEPLISIVIPLYKTPIVYLNALVESVQAQTYGNWELCLSNGSGTASETDSDGGRAADDLSTRLAELTREDGRIRVVTSGTPLGISENTNRALAVAQGDYIGFADHDDMLAPNALYEVVQLINERPGAEFIYSDEDKVDGEGKRYFTPHFKPDFNPDMLRSTNYICHFTVVSRGLYERVGGLDTTCDGSQDYDFILRCTENVSGEICHIPKVLYHWRTHADSTAEKPEHKLYAFEAGARALDAHYARTGLAGKAEIMVHSGYTYWGIYRTHYELKEEPPVSVILAAGGDGRNTASCLSSVLRDSQYQNTEILLVTDKDQRDTAEQLSGGCAERVRTVSVREGESLCEAQNRAAREAKGEYLLFLSGEITSVEPEAVTEMLSYCRREDVGAAGAKIYGPDGRVAHAGIILGVGADGLDEQFRRFRREDPGYFGRAIMAQDISAVSADCLMVKASLFRETGMFEDYSDRRFAGADLCLRLKERGYRTVFVPAAGAHSAQTESAHSRAVTQESRKEEIKRFQKKWMQGDSFEDPCYNPNLSHRQAIYKFDT